MHISAGVVWRLKQVKMPIENHGGARLGVALALAAFLLAPSVALAQAGGSSSSGASSSGSSSSLGPTAPTPASSSTYQGSVVTAPATSDVLPLSLEKAIALALQHNLGLIVSQTNVSTAGGQKLRQLQDLLPTVTGTYKIADQETNLKAEGLTIPGFPTIIGPYGYQDVRASMTWSLLNISSLQKYLASKHNFTGTQLTFADAKDLVILTTGNAFLVCVADASTIRNDQAQVDSSKVSLDQAVANHQAGTAPLLDELRARVDYQTQQQNLISAQNQYEKDKIALARTIGLPLDQKFELTDLPDYVPLPDVDPKEAQAQAEKSRQDVASAGELVKGAAENRKAATAERYPTIAFNGDFGDIGQTLGHSHSTFTAVGTASVPIFEEAKLRSDARQEQAALDLEIAQLNNLRGSVQADVADSILDIQTAAKQVEVSRSNVQLATQELSDAQERYANGVSDNLAVTQALASVAQANSQYVTSLYQHNIAKLELARAMGVIGTKYQQYLGGK
jgi:outer membrane protein TolC